MRLIYVSTAAPFSFGEAFITPEIVELQRRGHSVTVIPVRPRQHVRHGDVAAFIHSTIRQPLMSGQIVKGSICELLRDPVRTLDALRLIARSRTPTILAKNLAVVPKGLWLARTARNAAVDHIHAHWAGTTATTALIASVVSGIPWSFTAHRWDIPENNLILEKGHTARFVRAIDRQGAAELEPLLGPHRHKLRVIAMGVETGQPAAPPCRAHGSPLRVVIGAHLFEKKGHVYAIDAVRRLVASGTDVVADCVGHGPLQPHLERLAAAAGVQDRVRFHGLVSHPELLSRLRSVEWDVALLPSVSTATAKEGIPVFLVEAMAAGLPVVASATGGIPELLEGGAGLLVPERDAGAIASALRKLNTDEQLRCHLADAGRQRVLDRFQVDATVSTLIGLFASSE